MFVVGSAAPTASGRPPAMEVATNELVVRCWAAAAELCAALGPQLSRFFGNFDKLVAAGWLLGDVVLGFLMGHADAFTIGRKVGKLAPALVAAFAAPRRKAGKAKMAGGDDGRARAFAAADVEEAALRAAAAALPLLPACPPSGY